MRADFLTMDGLEDMTYNDVTSSSSTSYTVNNARKTFQISKQFGELNVRGYGIDAVSVTFPDNELAVVAKIGDTFVISGNTYEVTAAELKTSNTRWKIDGQRAYIETDFATTCDIQRATLSVNSAGAQGETFADTTTSVSCIVMAEDDVSDLMPKLAVRGDLQTTSFFIAQSVTIGPMDRIEYAGRFYRINSIVNEGRVSRLKQIRCQIYA